MKAFSPSRRRELGGDEFPLRTIIAFALLIGLVALMPATFSKFIHHVGAQAITGMQQAHDPNFCALICATTPTQLKAIRAYPVAIACSATAPAKIGAKSPAPAACRTARSVCRAQNFASDAGKACTAKGWPISTKPAPTPKATT